MKIKSLNEFFEFDDDDEIKDIKSYLNRSDKDKFTSDSMRGKSKQALLAASITKNFEKIKKMMRLSEGDLNDIINYNNKYKFNVEDPYGEEDWEKIPGEDKISYLESMLRHSHDFIGNLNNFNYYMNKEKWEEFNKLI